MASPDSLRAVSYGWVDRQRGRSLLMASPDSLRAVINALHMAILDHQDPQAKAQMSQCLMILTKIQAQDHANAKQVGSAQQVAQSLGGASGY